MASLLGNDTTNKGPEYGKYILIAQSVYYLVTGLWPLLHIGSFMEITGYKTDTWLVKTVEVLTTAIAFAFIVDILTKQFSTAVAILSVTAALGFLSIDSYYTLLRVIRLVYLADAAMQLGFIGWWVWVALRGR